jgi:hypothetical protein
MPPSENILNTRPKRRIAKAPVAPNWWTVVFLRIDAKRVRVAGRGKNATG